MEPPAMPPSSFADRALKHDGGPDILVRDFMYERVGD
jgi:hypothetical protein